MEPEFSEFSFGFALTSELMSVLGLKRLGAPLFPTQRQEAMPGGGYDVRLPGVPIFLQFKRSHSLNRRSKKQAALFSGSPFYRFAVTRSSRSPQHELLLDLEAQGNCVLYAAPIFATNQELFKHYTHDRLAKESLFIRPSEIGPLSEGDPHHVCFRRGDRTYLCSDPREVNPVDMSEVIDGISRGVAMSVDRTRRSAEELSEKLIRSYESSGEKSRASTASALRATGARRDRNPVQFLELVARALFGLEVLVVPD
jgi:hypothetical protein